MNRSPVPPPSSPKAIVVCFVSAAKDDRYIFIEANPAPMFKHFENVTGYDITGTLIHNLIK